MLETRQGSNLSTLRRRQCVTFEAHRFATNEIYEPWFSHNQSRISRAAAALSKRIDRWLVRDRIANDPRPSAVIAAEVGYHRDSVRHIKRTHA